MPSKKNYLTCHLTYSFEVSMTRWTWVGFWGLMLIPIISRQLFFSTLHNLSLSISLFSQSLFFLVQFTHNLGNSLRKWTQDAKNGLQYSQYIYYNIYLYGQFDTYLVEVFFFTITYFIILFTGYSILSLTTYIHAFCT